MTAEQTGMISGAVVAILQVIKAGGLANKNGVLWAALFSVLGVALWGWSQGDLGRATAFSYFVACSVVLTSAAGVFGLINKSAETVTSIKGAGTALMQSLTGTGDGK